MARFLVALMGFADNTEKAVQMFEQNLSVGSSVDVSVYGTTTDLAIEATSGKDSYPQVVVISKLPTPEELLNFKKDMQDVLDVLEDSDVFQLITLTNSELSRIFYDLQQIHPQSQFAEVDRIIASAISQIILGHYESSSGSKNLHRALQNLNTQRDEEVVPVIEEEEIAPIIEDDEDEEVAPVIEETNSQSVENFFPLNIEEEKVIPVAEDEEEVAPAIDEDEEIVPVVEEVVSSLVIEEKSPEPVQATPRKKDKVPRQKSSENLFTKLFSKQRIRSEAISSSAKAINDASKQSNAPTPIPVSAPTPAPQILEPESTPVLSEPEYTPTNVVVQETTSVRSKRSSARQMLQQQCVAGVNYCSRNKIMIVTGLPCSGITTTAASIAFTTASSGIQTLLIDGDMQNRSLSYLFDTSAAGMHFLSKGGMTSILKQKRYNAPLDFAINPYHNLFVLCGDMQSILDYQEDSSVELTDIALLNILNNSRTSNTLTVLDLPLNFLLENPNLMAVADNILFTVPATSYGIDRYLSTIHQTMFKCSNDTEMNSRYIEFINKLNTVLTQSTGRTFYQTCEDLLQINRESFQTIIYDSVYDDGVNTDIICNVSVVGEFIFLPDVGNQYAFPQPAAAFEDSDIGPLFKSECLRILNTLK